LRESVFNEFASVLWFDAGTAHAELMALKTELKNTKPGKHRHKNVLAVYLPARIFGPSPLSGLTPSQCNILKALPMQVTRDPRNDDRCDKALVSKIEPAKNEIREHAVPVYPRLEPGKYVSFNGNGRRKKNHGYGFKIATWMKDIGYRPSSTALSELP
jgi:hypothetical protein